MLDFIDLHPTLIYSFQLYLVMILLITIKPIRKKLFLLRLILVTAVYVLLGIFLPDLTLAHFLYVPFVVMFCATIPCIYCLNSVNIKELLFMTISAFLIQFVAECTTFALRGIFILSPDSWMWIVMSFIAYTIIYLIYYLFYLRRIRSVDIKAWKAIVLSIVIFAGIFSIYNLFMYDYREGILTRISVFYFITAAVSTGALSLVLFLSNRSDRADVERQIMMKLLQQEQEHYEKLAFQQDVVNRKCHDLKYQISALRQTTNSDEGQNYFQQLEQDIMFYDGIAKTGNVALDNILSDKYIFCKQNKIQFTYIVNSKVLEKMDTLDIYSLFGNAIDNAIDCVSRYSNVEERLISLQVTKTGKLSRIHIENYCEKDPFDSNRNLITQKEDRSMHGFGVKSIRYIVDKYKGYVSFHYERPFFNLDIMIPEQD